MTLPVKFKFLRWGVADCQLPANFRGIARQNIFNDLCTVGVMVMVLAFKQRGARFESVIGRKETCKFYLLEKVVNLAQGNWRPMAACAHTYMCMCVSDVVQTNGKEKWIASEQTNFQTHTHTNRYTHTHTHTHNKYIYENNTWM